MKTNPQVTSGSWCKTNAYLFCQYQDNFVLPGATFLEFGGLPPYVSKPAKFIFVSRDHIPLCIKKCGLRQFGASSHFVVCDPPFVRLRFSEAMSGSPDWKPGHQVRPSSSTSNRKFGTTAPSSVKVSPSSTDMSGRFAREHSRKRPLSDVTDDDPGDRRVQPRTAVFENEVVHFWAPPLPTAKASPQGTPFTSMGTIFEPPDVTRISLSTGRSILPPRQFSMGHGPPFVPAPQAMWPGGMFKPGWHIGAYFR